jgi:arylsulfatase
MFGKKDRAFDLISAGKGPGKEEDWVEVVQNRPQDKPFFFWFASADAHRGWQQNDAAPTYQAQDAIVPPYLVDTELTQNDLAQYYHEISRFDRYVGDVVAELKSQGQLDNTLIIVMADNGRPFPRCKTRLYNDGIRTPFVLHYPQGIKQPAVCESLASSIDISATILELAGTAKPDSVQGVSLLPLFKNPQTDVRDVVFAEHNWHVHKNHERMVRTKEYLYIKNSFPNQQNLCSEAYQFDAGEELWKAQAAGRTTPVQQLLFANPSPAEELYKVADDPDQFNNLASDPKFADVKQKLSQVLADWTRQTGDTVPSDPTPDRDAPPRIENGQFFPPQGKNKAFTHREMPGASAGAEQIHDSGPVRLK